MCLFPHPLGIYKDVCLGEDRKAKSIRHLRMQTSACWEQSPPCSQFLPTDSSGGFTNLRFQNLLISSRILLVISNWSCLKNSERLGHRKSCNCEMVCLSVKATCREKQGHVANTLILAENGRHWLSCGCWIFQFFKLKLFFYSFVWVGCLWLPTSSII